MKTPKDVEGYFFEDKNVLLLREVLRHACHDACTVRESYIHEYGRSKPKNGTYVKWLDENIEKAKFLLKLVEERQYCLFLSELPWKGEIHRFTINQESLHPDFIKPKLNQ